MLRNITEKNHQTLENQIKQKEDELNHAIHMQEAWTKSLAWFEKYLKENEAKIVNLFKAHKFVFTPTCTDPKRPYAPYARPIQRDISAVEWFFKEPNSNHLYISLKLNMSGRAPVQRENAQYRIVQDIANDFKKEFNGHVHVSVNRYSLSSKNNIMCEIWIIKDPDLK